LTQFFQLLEPLASFAYLFSLADYLVELGRSELLTRIYLLLVVTDLIEVRLKRQIMIVGGAALLLTLSLQRLNCVDYVAHAAPRAKK